MLLHTHRERERSRLSNLAGTASSCLECCLIFLALCVPLIHVDIELFFWHAYIIPPLYCNGILGLIAW